MKLTNFICRVNKANQTWEGLLNAAGGKLNFDKCFVYLLQWEFDGEGTLSLRSKKSIKDEVGEFPFQFCCADGSTVVIKHRDVSQWHRTLGIRVQPNLSKSAEIERLTKKCEDLKQAIRLAKLTREEARTTARSIVSPSIGYAACTMALLKSDWRHIQGGLVQELTAACGYNRNSPTAVVHVDRGIGGCGIPDFFAIQGADSVVAVVAYLRRGCEVGKLITILLGWVQLTLGTSYQILQYPKHYSNYIGGKWIQSFCSFLKECDLLVHVPSICVPKTRRLNDKLIMEMALASNYSASQIRAINNCRLFLKVECISELVSTDGRRIYRSLWDNPPTIPSYSKLLWPRQTIPGPRSWRTFRHLLESLVWPITRRLRVRLGEWTNIEERVWPWYYGTQSSLITSSHRGNNGNFYIPINSRWGSLRFRLDNVFDSGQCNEDIIPIDVRAAVGEQMVCIVDAPPLHQDMTNSNNQSSPTSWEEFMANRPVWEQ